MKMFVPVGLIGALLAVQPLPAPAQRVERQSEAILLGVPSRSFLGIGVAEITGERAADLKLKEERGVEITFVEPDSPAAKAGLKVHDAVLEYNGQRVEGTEQFVRLVRETPAGRTVKLGISREGKLDTVPATIASRKNKPVELGQWNWPEGPRIQIPDMPRATMSWRSGALGIEAESLSPQLAEFFGVKEGVLVRSVGKDSPAAKAGVKAGDVIVRVEDEKVATPTEVTRAIRSRRGAKTIALTLIRDKHETTIKVELESEGRLGPQGQFVQLQELGC